VQNIITRAQTQVAAKKNDDGFTLIELLIVIMVLGILAAIVVFGLARFKDDATEASACAAKKTIETAADAYLAKDGHTVAQIVGAVDGTNPLVADKYLKAAPPAANASSIAAAGTSFTVTTTGAVASCV
jgi:prepilin-type N-terminal cleavage/methylation domain-containing protein